MRIAQILVIVVYALVVLWIAKVAQGRTKTLEDYLRPRLGPWVVAFTGFATAFSTSVLVVGASFGYRFGAVAVWIAVPQALGLAALFLVFAPRMTLMVDRLGSLTVPEFLGERYKSDAIRALASVILFIFCVGYLIVVYRGLGVVLASILNISYTTAVVAAGLLSAIYVAFGGQLAVANTDVLQGWLMTGGLLILFPMALMRAGGMSEIHARLAEISPKMVEFPGNFAPGILIGLILVFSLGMLGQPQLLNRIMFIRNRRDIPKIAIITVIVGVFAAWISYYSGAVSRVLIPGLTDPDTALPELIKLLMHPVLAAVLVTAITAAAMSTTDSLLIMAAGAVSRDIYQKLINRKASDEITQKLGAALSLLLGLLGMLMALKPPAWFIYLMAFVWAVWAATFLFPILYGIYWRGVTTSGGLAGMILGPAVAVIWQVAKQPFKVHPLFPSLLVAAIVIPLVSAFTPKMRPEFLDSLFSKGAGRMAAAGDD